MGRAATHSKRRDPYLGGLCFITDRYSCDLTPVEMTALVLRAGVKWVQYRDKDKDRCDFYRNALQLRELTRAFGAHLIINDHADIAAAVEADGVHVGQDDLPLKHARRIVGDNRIIGISTHSVREAVEAQAGGADYIGFGPVFETSTKDAAGEPKGASGIAEVQREVDIPVVAIGGIQRNCIQDLFQSGARAVAVASAILRGDDICCEAEEFIAAIKSCAGL
jgi:thiamine-phosphate pyrophosphorylase